jgi:hypothetical protein
MTMKTLGLIVIAAVLSVGGIAHADDAAAAEAMFQRGKAHMDAGRVAEACADFSVSESLDSSVGTLLNLGECNEKLGKTASAWASFNKASVKAEREGQIRRKEYSDGRAAQVEAKMTRLELRVSGERPQGLKVTRNGEDMTLLVGAAVPVDPSNYAFEATAPGYEGWTKTLAVTGEGKTVVVEVPALEASPVTSTVEPIAPKSGGTSDLTQSASTTDGKPDGRRRVIALSVGGVGAAAVATGLVFGVIARSNNRKSWAHCDGNLCDQAGVDLVADAKRAANISTVLVAVGGAALVTGGVLWLTAPSAASGDASLSAAPLLGADQFGLALSGGF